MAEEAHNTDVAEREEAEVRDVIEGTDLDKEVSHITSRQRDHALEEYNIGGVDTVLLPPETNKQQLINDIVDHTEIPGADDSVGELIQNLDQLQNEIDTEIEQLQTMHSNQDQIELRRTTRPTRGQRQNRRYDEEYELFITHNNDGRNITPMDELETSEHIMGVVFT